MRKVIFPALLVLLASFAIHAQQITQGELDAVGKGGRSLGLCPLKNTKVEAEISGFLSRVKVTQEFENNFSEKIEAIYVFPLPRNAAVDDMTMRIGERVIRGKVMKREEARDVYEAARSNGQIASLLDQERPNIFTQSVANILPGEKVIIEISYVETLKYEDGSYEFVFPMVVGPRYIPGKASGGPASDTDKVPDGSKITPPIVKDRVGHDISIEVKLDAGLLVESVTSKSHQIESLMLSASRYSVRLQNEKTIPNKDFILRYDVAGKKIEDSVLTHRTAKGGYFTLILQPPDNVRPQDVTPKEIVFVLDTSGSMSGFPIEKAKESMKLALEGLNPQDTFNLITFAGDTAVLFERPVPATPENLRKAQAFLESRRGGGGTEMMKAIRAALDPSDSQEHIRVVCFMTDGVVGNDLEIIGEVKKHPNARVFSFGIGGSVNRFLLDKMAEEGRGEVEYVALGDDGSAAAKRFHERVRSPLLTDISLDFGPLNVADVYPKRTNDLFSAKPVIVHGRFTQPGSGVIKLKGRSFGREVVREIAVNFPESDPNHDVLATLWARTRIDDLMSQDYAGLQSGTAKPEIRESITNLGLEYRLMTQFTSYVAVEERIVTDGGQPRKIEVPVEMPEGMTYEGIFGRGEERPTGSLGAPTGLFTVYNGQNLRTGYQFSAPSTGDPRNPFVKPSTDPRGYISQIYAGRRNGQKIAVVASASDLRSIAEGLTARVLPKPKYPANTKAVGVVNVEVTLDANGVVTSAKAVSGDTSLHPSAETAARKTKFEIPKLEREVLGAAGVIAYNFANKTVTVSEYLQDVEVELRPNKLHSSLRAIVERLKNNRVAAPGDAAKFVKDGKADVIVRVRELTPDIVEELKKLGFEVLAEMPSGNAIVGRIAVGQISALAEMEPVKFVSPHYR